MNGRIDSRPDLNAEFAIALQPPCEVREIRICPIHGTHRSACQDTAAWIVRTQCECGHVDIALVCDGHVGHVRGETFRFVCESCGHIDHVAASSTEKL